MGIYRYIKIELNELFDIYEIDDIEKLYII